MIAASTGRRNGAPDDGAARDGPPAVKAIRDYLRGRRARAAIFGANLFADPAWDMLLELYASEGEGRRISVHGLCACSGVAPTTALRWLKRLQAAGLIARVADTADSRRSWVRLTDQGRISLSDCLARQAASAPSPLGADTVTPDALSRLGVEVIRDQLARDCLMALAAGEMAEARRLVAASTLLEPVIDPAEFRRAYESVLYALTG